MFNNIYCFSKKLEKVNITGFDTLKDHFNIKLPLYYEDYISTFGVGFYCDFLRVLSPTQILEEYEGRREEWLEYFYFWKDSEGILSKDEFQKCILFADSIDGDEIIFHPQRIEYLFVLPRHDSKIYTIIDGFNEPMKWNDNTTVIRETPKFQYFRSFCDLRTIELFTNETSINKNIVLKIVQEHCSKTGILDIVDNDFVKIFLVEAIQGKIQILISNDKRISIRIEYDKDFQDKVDKTITKLIDTGFVVRCHYL